MKTLILLLLLNHPNGEQAILSESVPMVASECHTLETAIWHLPDAVNPVAYVDESGPVQRLDAACVTPDQIKR